MQEKVSKYPDNTVFYFHAWTFGYENVWIALSAFLKSRIHLDDYRARIYGSLSTLDKSQLHEVGLDIPSDNKSLRALHQEIREAPALCGFINGNHIQSGCLTSQEAVRIHSCERGMGCRVMDSAKNTAVVHIIPIITRSKGIEILELGAGGGKGDLDQKEELETGHPADMVRLLELCASSIEDPEILAKVHLLLRQAAEGDKGTIDIDLQSQKQGPGGVIESSLNSLVAVLSSHVSKNEETAQTQGQTIRFPYSRHSSYTELRGLIRAFRPMGVYPCTVDTDSWTPELSMRSLFGDLCSADNFHHDLEMTKGFGSELQCREGSKRSRQDTQRSTQSSDDAIRSPTIDKRPRLADTMAAPSSEAGLDLYRPVALKVQDCALDNATGKGQVARHTKESFVDLNPSTPEWAQPDITLLTATDVRSAPPGSTRSASCRTLDMACPSINIDSRKESALALPSFRKGTIKSIVTNQELAYNAAMGNGLTWSDYGGLVSTRSKANQEEQEL